MPFLHTPLRAALLVRPGLPYHHGPWLLPRNFHTSRPLCDDIESSQNHYETLNVRTDASHAEIKKSVFLFIHFTSSLMLHPTHSVLTIVSALHTLYPQYSPSSPSPALLSSPNCPS